MHAAAGPASHVAVVHEDGPTAEKLTHILRTGGHRVTAVVPGRRIVQQIVDSAPDLVLISPTLIDPPVSSIVRGIRQALGNDPRILLLFNYDPQDAPEEADDVIKGDPLEKGELLMRVGRLLRDRAERRTLQRKTSELLGLYKMSWAFSLAGGADALFGHIARHSAQMLKARRGLVLLYDEGRRQLVGQPSGHGLTPEQVQRVRYSVDGEARSRWNFRNNGPLLSNRAGADTRLLPDIMTELQVESLMAVPITQGPRILGLLAVADRYEGGPFTDEDLNLLLALAGQTTVAVENLRLHDEIKKANQLLQEYDRLKSEFVGIVAHDFRRPLMAIRGFAELVLEEPDLALETRQEFMRTVINETEHLALLANDTLLITQIETGEFSFNFREIDLGPFILEAVPLGLSDHSVLMDVPADFPKIWADPDRLRQVLTNLVTNAVKYSPEGGSITVRGRQRGLGHVVIAVVDHGLGIPSDQIDRLFQKFARVRTDEHMQVSGTGLGLYICRLIVEGHGGQIWVESEPGEGSMFAMALPLDARAARRAQAEDGERKEAAPPKPQATEESSPTAPPADSPTAVPADSPDAKDAADADTSTQALPKMSPTRDDETPGEPPADEEEPDADEVKDPAAETASNLKVILEDDDD